MEIITNHLTRREEIHKITIKLGIFELEYDVMVVGLLSKTVTEYHKRHFYKLTTSQKRQIRELIYGTFNE